MKKHTYFYVRVSTPISYSDFIDKELQFYAKIKKLDFNTCKDDFKLRQSITEHLLNNFSDINIGDFELKNYMDRDREFTRIIEKLSQSIYNIIIEEFDAKLTDSANVFLVEMKYFKQFILKFKTCSYVDWNSISSSKYYDWDIESLIIGKDVLNWDCLINNKITFDLIKSKEFPKELNEFLTENHKIIINEREKEDHKSLFVIKEYSGNLSLREYFMLVEMVEKTVKSKIPIIKEIKWLSSYSLLFDLMSREELKFDLSEFDYILAYEEDVSQDKTDSNVALKMALEQKKEIIYSLDEIIKKEI